MAEAPPPMCSAEEPRFRLDGEGTGPEAGDFCSVCSGIPEPAALPAPDSRVRRVESPDACCGVGACMTHTLRAVIGVHRLPQGPAWSRARDSRAYSTSCNTATAQHIGPRARCNTELTW